MVSLGSLSLFLETPKEGLFLPGSSGWRRRGGMSSASPISCRGRRSRHHGLRRVLGLEETGKVGSFLSFSPSSGGRPSIYAEASKGSEVTEREDDSSDGKVNVSDEKLKTTIRKGREVLARQKELLQEIVEKKKFTSSFKNSIINTEIDVVTSNGISSTIPDMSLALTNGNTTGKLLDAINPIVPSQTTKTKMPNISSGGDREKSLNIKKKIKDTSKVENSIESTLVMSKETGSAATVMPSMLPKAAESYTIEEEKLGKITEAYLEDTSLIKDTGSEEEKTIPPPLAGANVMNVIVVSAECAPWSKTGGLGDVSGSLPKALAKRGHRVMVVTPRYGCYSDLQDIGLRKIYKIDGQDMEVTYHHAFIDGVDFVFIESAMFRNRDRDIYGGQRMDILKRMVLLCKVAVEVPWLVPCGGSIYGDGNLVFIANDWHTALLPVYLKTYYRDNGLMIYARSVLVIHNIAHQGRGPPEDFRYLDLPGHCLDLFRMYDPVGGDHLNVFRAGLKTADRVITVSRGYAWELKTIEGGWGLHEVIKENDWKLQGIVNGIDTTDWNPAVDIHLKHDGYTNYSLDTLKAGKAQCKAALQRELHLPVRDDIPLIGFIGRLDGQKGVDIIADATPWMASQDMQLILLGTGRNDLEDMLRRFEGLYHDKVIGRVGFSVSLAHRITAGCDILLMPSRFEPCGLNQLYAMTYGTIPVVHAVGGLRDTVTPFDPFTESGLGWTFDRAEQNKLIDSLRNCFETYRNHKSSWEGLQRRGMMQDLSWDNAAEKYEEVLVEAKYQW